MDITCRVARLSCRPRGLDPLFARTGLEKNGRTKSPANPAKLPLGSAG
ncbi:hypothetical protein ACFVTC_15400 [Streptomyces sp. NPDC057950]